MCRDNLHYKISGEYVFFIDMTPHKVWYSNNPLLSHNKLFGYDALFDVFKEKRNKLYKKVVKNIFIGYKEGMKGYKL
jgi:hypothetical protein